MNGEDYNKAVSRAVELFDESVNFVPRTTSGKPYKKRPRKWYLVNLPDGLKLVHKLPMQPKGDKEYSEPYEAICSIKDHSTDGLTGKDWDTLIDGVAKSMGVS